MAVLRVKSIDTILTSNHTVGKIQFLMAGNMPHLLAKVLALNQLEDKAHVIRWKLRFILKVEDFIAIDTNVLPTALEWLWKDIGSDPPMARLCTHLLYNSCAVDRHSAFGIGGVCIS